MTTQDKRFALLIDGDNIASDYIKTILDELAPYGTVTYKRIYGDWTQPNLGKWKSVLLDYSITPMQQYAYTSGKNATDSAMIIDAMDILYTGKVDGFCLASSDSDFTRLAARLREAGMTVIGMGKQQTPAAFVAACTEFKFLDILSGEETVSDPTDDTSTTLLSVEEVKETVRKLIDDNDDIEGADGWVIGSFLIGLIRKTLPTVDPRYYGGTSKKWIPLLEQWGFPTKRVKNPNNLENEGAVVYIRSDRYGKT
ncbi:MAG: NYN domain-containing protein [Clostridia bacterium]|nr:NYN domain-containing protein [Clostridia bacterium]